MSAGRRSFRVSGTCTRTSRCPSGAPHTSALESRPRVTWEASDDSSWRSATRWDQDGWSVHGCCWPGWSPEAVGTVYADTPEEGRAVVDQYHAAGFQQMKLYTLIKPDVAGAIIRRAHELGMSVTGHVPRAMTLESMVDSGTDNVAHLPVRGDTASAPVKAEIRLLAAHHVVIDPTVSWNELLGHARQSPL